LPGSDPVRPNDSEMPPASPATNQVFIISRDPLQAFIAALSPALRDCEEFTIIVDRRRAGLENVGARPAIERRHHPWVDAKVETDGFAIVPLSTTDDPQNPPWIECVIDHQSAADDAEADERELWRALSLKHRLAGMFGPKDNVEAGGLRVISRIRMTLPGARLPTSTRSSRVPNQPTCPSSSRPSSSW
jgi:hypothetical protein